MNEEELLRYSRHILLPSIDVEGQEKIIASKVLVIGAGGLGCPAALYLAASGVGEIVIADDDHVAIGNLQRQIAYSLHDVGKAKVVAIKKILSAMNPLVRITALQERLQEARLQEMVEKVDVILDCSDNFTTRYQVNLASRLAQKPLVSGASIRFEGQLSVFNFSENSPCYACLYGENTHDEVLTCSESGVFSPLVGIIGSMMAAEALKIMVGFDCALDGRVMVCDIRNMDWRTFTLSRDPLCAVCMA